jgi:hypothetical protein
MGCIYSTAVCLHSSGSLQLVYGRRSVGDVIESAHAFAFVTTPLAVTMIQQEANKVITS